MQKKFDTVIWWDDFASVINSNVSKFGILIIENVVMSKAKIILTSMLTYHRIVKSLLAIIIETTPPFIIIFF